MAKPSPKTRTHTLIARKGTGEKITMLTAYDALWGGLLDEVGVDVILVGDSLGNVILGHQDTIPVTLDDMVHHTAAVRRGVKSALLCADMPFMTARLSPDEVLLNAARLFQEGGAEAVKIEGGREVAENIHVIVEAGLPVVGHLGLTPQSIHQLGGYRIQGKKVADARELVENAKVIQDAGAFMIVLELVHPDVAREITEAVSVPTIGIGSGPDCDGQVLVSHDLLGLSAEIPRHVKPYATLRKDGDKALRKWLADVRSRRTP